MRRAAGILAIVLAIACAGVTAAKVDKPPQKSEAPHPSHPDHPRADDPSWPQWSPAPFGGTPLPRPSATPGPRSGPGVIMLPDTAAP